MSRRYQVQAVVGAALLALVGALLAFAGTPASAAVAFQIGLLAFAGAAMVCTGLANPVRERVGAGRLTGVADIALGISVPLGSLPSKTGGDWFLFGLTALGGLTLVFIGLDYLRGGRYLDVPEP